MVRSWDKIKIKNAEIPYDFTYKLSGKKNKLTKQQKKIKIALKELTVQQPNAYISFLLSL